MLNIPLVGFLPGTDERVTGTIDDDGLAGSEGQFLACSFWLVNALALNDRVDEARALFERLLALRDDVGLLAEDYDVERRRQVGNFPQAFSHLALINAAQALTAAAGRAGARSSGTSGTGRTCRSLA